MPDLKDLELPKPLPVLISTDQSLSQNIKEMLWIHLFQSHRYSSCLEDRLQQTGYQASKHIMKFISNAINPF